MTRPIDDYIDPRTIQFSELVDENGEQKEVGQQDDTCDDSLRVEDIIRSLRKRQRQVVILMDKGYKPAEIAIRLGVSVWAVYRITLRIRQRLIAAGLVIKNGRRVSR